MTHDKEKTHISLSRRKILGSVGVIGASGLVTGFGTSAFFSDQEQFANNRLVAGELDMKVAWEEHYSDWSADELDGIPEENVTMLEQFPDKQAPPSSIFGVRRVPGIEFNTNADLEQWKENTVVESGGSLQCPDQPGVTAGDDPPRKVVHIEDVKPGDEGEVTFGFRLCDNPGYVWLNGRLVDKNENGKTEPEMDDPDEGSGVELLDEIRTLLWYDDDADNIYEPEEGDKDQPLDCVMVLDTSVEGDAFDELIDATKGMIDGLTAADTGDNVTVGIVATGGGATLWQDLSTDEETVRQAVEDLRDSPGTPISEVDGANDLEGGIRQGHEELLLDSQFGDLAESESFSPEPVEDGPRRGVPKIMIVLNGSAPEVNSDGSPPDPNFNGMEDSPDSNPRDNADAAKEDDPPVQIITVGFGSNPQDGLLEDLASSGPLAFIGDDDLPTKLEGVVKAIGSEECFFHGTLGQLLNLLSSTGPNDVAGIPLDGYRITPSDEVTGTDTDQDGLPDEDFGIGTGDANDRECFPALRDHHIGFTWWLPLDHGNEVQSDSVTFDLGFYTEQCRHNDGSGIANNP